MSSWSPRRRQPTAIALRPASIDADHPDEPSSSNCDPPADTDAAGYLLSTSKDGLLKLWDLSLQHCVEPSSTGSNEIWSLAVSTGCAIGDAGFRDRKQADEDDEDAADRNAIWRWWRSRAHRKRRW